MPLFVLAFVLPLVGHFIVAAALFAIAAFSDLLDGFLARLLHQESAFGRFLDPVADKLMVATALVFMLWQQPQLILAFPVAIIICREIAVSALREWMAEVGAGIRVSSYGKLKTMAQLLSICFLIVAQDSSVLTATQQELLWWLGLTLLYLAAFLTIWSMFLYLKSTYKEMRKLK